MTTVISVRGRDRAELFAMPDFVYVGRGTRGWKGSIFGNPYPASKFSDGAGGAVAWFFEDMAAALKGQRVLGRSLMGERVDYRGVFDQMAGNIEMLMGKTLGCWCCDWRPGEPITTPCHAIILAQLANALEAVPS